MLELWNEHAVRDNADFFLKSGLAKETESGQLCDSLTLNT